MMRTNALERIANAAERIALAVEVKTMAAPFDIGWLELTSPHMADQLKQAIGYVFISMREHSKSKEGV
jgi:hypothetical protein